MKRFGRLCCCCYVPYRDRNKSIVITNPIISRVRDVKKSQDNNTNSSEMNQSEHRHILCFNAAQQGEELCRSGNTEQGIEQLEKALYHGTADVYLLSAIYAQLGNGYYTLKNFHKSVEYHLQDLVLCRAMCDKLGETNAYSNLAIVRSSMGDYDKAIPCVDNQMSLAIEINDSQMLCRAYYTKGYVYLQKARDSAPSMKEEFSLFPYPVRNNSIPIDTREDLYTAVENFQNSAKYAEELNDQNYCGLSYGNLGHTHFLLEEYEASIRYHQKRLEIARSVDDKRAARRAFTNLGNAYFFASEYAEAIKCYQDAVQVAEELNDKYSQSHAWFSVGIVATVDCKFELATQAHLKHLQLSRQLEDKQAQARSLTSLASIYIAYKDIPKALYFLIIKYKLITEMRDHDSELKTRSKIKIAVQSDPESVINDDKIVLDSSVDPDVELLSSATDSPPIDTTSISFALREDCRAASAPNLSEPLSKFIMDCAKGLKPVGLVLPMMDNMYAARSMPNVKPSETGDFLDMYEKLSKRYDDQRCDPSILIQKTNDTRQADTFRSGSTSKLYGSRSSLRKSFMGTFKKPFVKNKKKKMDMVPTSTPAPNNFSRPISMDCSHISAIPKASSIKSLQSAMSAISTPEPSNAFRVPELPDRVSRKNFDEDDKENTYSHRSDSAHNFKMSRYASSDTFFSVDGRSLDLDYIDEEGIEMDNVSNNSKRRKPAGDGSYNPEAILDLIATYQGRRMNEQRADFLPGLRNRQTILNRFREELEQRKKMLSGEEREVDEKLYNLIVKFQGDRIEEQRSTLGGTSPIEKDVSDIVLKMASGRIDEQRADLKSPTTKTSPENATSSE